MDRRQEKRQDLTCGLLSEWECIWCTKSKQCIALIKSSARLQFVESIWILIPPKIRIDA